MYMFKFEANESVIIEQKQALEAALSSDPKTQKILRRIIRAEIFAARDEVVSNIKFKNGDPRGTARAVRTTVYKKILGANINIFNSRKAHGSNDYEPQRYPSARGGNRRKRSERTATMMSYSPLDRGMILRWQDSGTREREIAFTTNDRRKADKWNKHPNSGYRGSISAGDFFRSYGERAIGRMSDRISYIIENELANIMNIKN